MAMKRGDYDRPHYLGGTMTDEREQPKIGDDDGEVTVDEPTKPALSGTSPDDFGREAPEPGEGEESS
jgi:hypothetical protein